jgi:glycerol-3-phosphate dehydrogenase subunit C
MIRNPKQPEFWDPADLHKEIDRVFDICHQCRLCFNLCPSFHALFKHVDENDGDVRRLTEKDIAEVTDNCYQCKICYVKCPYTPPHQWDLDFPRLLLREKAVRVKQQGVSFQDRYLGDPDRAGKMGCHFAPMANLANRNWLFRKIMSWTVGIHEDRNLPDFAEQTFQEWFAQRPHPLKSNKKIALFHSCFVNYYSVNQGIAAVEVLEKNGFEVIVPKQVCCGMPFLDGGEIDKATANMHENLKSFRDCISEKIPIVSIGPTCTYVLKNEFAYFTQDADADSMGNLTKDLSEFLMELKAKGELNMDFQSTPSRKIVYQIPCHLRAQNMGYKSMDLLRSIPNVKVQLVEQCSAMDGTWGMKKQFYDISLKMAGKLFRELKESPAEIVCTDCPLSALQIEQGTQKVPLHPVEILHRAYGL